MKPPPALLLAARMVGPSLRAVAVMAVSRGGAAQAVCIKVGVPQVPAVLQG